MRFTCTKLYSWYAVIRTHSVHFVNMMSVDTVYLQTKNAQYGRRLLITGHNMVWEVTEPVVFLL